MVNFSKEKMLITISNLFIYIAFCIVYWNIFQGKHSLNLESGLASLLLTTLSLCLLSAFLFIKSRYYKKNNISIVKLTKKTQLMIKFFIILEISAIVLTLLSILLSWIKYFSSDNVNIALYNVLLALILFLTIAASFLEVIFRFKIINYPNNISEKLEIKN